MQSMLNPEIVKILDRSASDGWVLEPDAKKIFKLAGLDVSEFAVARSAPEATLFAGAIGYPVAAKVVSPDILHKSDVGGVALGLKSPEELENAYQRFSALEGFAGIVVEKMLSGVELIIGAKNDEQFGPVILLGMGGIGVDIYRDTAIRMAPLTEQDVKSMVSSLVARRVIEGFRGSEPVDMRRLTSTLIDFSRLVMELESRVESIDLNPVMCSGSNCWIADARIILRASVSS